MCTPPHFLGKRKNAKNNKKLWPYTLARISGSGLCDHAGNENGNLE